jgi:hypothetical protein
MTRSNLHISLSSTDVLIAMLSSDLSGTHGVGGLARFARREPRDSHDSHEHLDLAAGSGRLPRLGSEGEPATEPEVESALDRMQIRRP